MLRAVFMGTPEFAVPSLHAAASAAQVVGVYTRPDGVSGRGSKRRPTPVKSAALGLGLPVYQPSTLRETSAQRELEALEPELLVVAAYGLILPREVLEIPSLGSINVHASLLPRWRGAAPIQRAILAGDAVTGVAIMRIEEGLDSGAYCLSAATQIAEKDFTQLSDELAVLGARLISEAIDRIDAGTCEWTEQDQAAVTYAEKVTKDDVALSPALTIAQAALRVRASSPQAPSRARIGGRNVTVISARQTDLDLEAGRVSCTKDAVLLGLVDGALSVERLKPEGRGEMAGCDWAHGARLDSSAEWTAVR